MDRSRTLPPAPALCRRRAGPRYPSPSRPHCRHRGAALPAIPTRHSITTRVVDDDQVGPTGLGALRREAGPALASDDRAPPSRVARNLARASSPVIPSLSCSRPASAPSPAANAGSLMSHSISMSSTELARFSRIAENSAYQGLAGKRADLRQRSSIRLRAACRSAVGPEAAESFSAHLTAEPGPSPRRLFASA